MTLKTIFWFARLPALILAVATLTQSQQPSKPEPPGIGNLDSVTVSGDTVTLRAGQDTVIAQIVEPNILRVNYQPQGQASPRTPVVDPNRVWRNDTPEKIDTQSDPIVVSTDRMILKISRMPLRFAIYDAANHLLLQEPKEGGVYPGGLRFAYERSSPFFGIDGTSLPAMNVDPRQDTRAGMRRSGGAVRAGRQGDGAAPLVYTTTYGLLVDSDGGDFDISEGMLRFSGGSRSDVEYFVVLGDPKTVMRGVGSISGYPPMMPKWTLGFMNSQWGTTEAEVGQIIDTYRAKRIPIDGFILDFDWKAWGEDDYGEWRWNSTSGPGNFHPGKFPDGASGVFARQMLDKGIKLVGIFKPRILLHNANGDLTVAARYAQDHNFFFAWEQPYQEYFSKRPALDIDLSLPAARAWYWEHMIPAFQSGIKYFWNDEADAIGNALFPNFQHANMERAMYEGARALGGQRVWSINRNFYLGAQRYAYAEWSGDVNTGFASMACQPQRMLSIINLGEPHWSMDTGGFHGHPSDENYARWMELAAFVPIMRVHGVFNEHRQPWVYAPQAEADAKSAIELRYRLMPYLYAYERQAHETDAGIVRPLFWDFPDDVTHTADLTDEWMFGDELLAAPILGEGQAHRSIYLPPGQWIDYFRGQRYEGGKPLVYSVNPQTWSDMPLFIRDGAIIPTQNLQQYVGESPVTRIYLDVFPTRTETSFSYYDDDGITYSYEKRAFYQQRLAASDNGTLVRFDASAPAGTYTPALRNYEVRLHGLKARSVTIDGAKSRYYANLTQLESAAGEGWTVGNDLYGSVTIVNVGATAEKHVAAIR